MVQSQFSLSWDAYKSNICGGFSALQQNGELVDMTLAADGHFVKVHQVLMALVSPYLKDLITSAPCQHPVIFLNNVSHKVLSSLLEYIYTGEVLISADSLNSFVETAKNLHIRGLENMKSNENVTYKVEDSNYRVSGTKKVEFPTDCGLEQIEIPASAKKVYVKYDSDLIKNKSNIKSRETPSIDINMDSHDYGDAMDEDDHILPDPSDNVVRKRSTPNKDAAAKLQYSLSIRGSLQIILNRYIYNILSVKKKTGIRRWRCVDYRDSKCKAFVVTKGNVVLNRANLHNHAFHDKKILQKIEKQAIFTALDEVEAYKEKCSKDEQSLMNHAGEMKDSADEQGTRKTLSSLT